MNTSVGYQSMYSNTGSYNTSLGAFALGSNQNGEYNTGMGNMAVSNNISGMNNTGSGSFALFNNKMGSNNSAFGYNSGIGVSNADFNQCTFIGAESYPTVNRANVTMLGYGISNGQCTADNQLLLGNTAVTQIRAQVTGITAYSDKRFKTDVQENVPGLDFVMSLKPVTYNEDPTILHRIWGTPDSILNKIDHSGIQKQRFIGFLAQDVEEAAKASNFEFPGIDIPENSNEVYTLRYVDFIMPLVKSIQEQQNQIELLSASNKKLLKIVEEQQSRIEKLENK